MTSDTCNKPILDACCGGRMFWFDPNNNSAIFMDNREIETTLCDDRVFTVSPDVVADFTHMPFEDKTFKLVVFDPPHLIRGGEKSWLVKKYGILEEHWQQQIKQGFDECMRVLDDFGVLVFKWNETQIRVSQIINAVGEQPLIGHKSGKQQNTHWMLFMKQPNR